MDVLTWVYFACAIYAARPTYAALPDGSVWCSACGVEFFCVHACLFRVSTLEDVVLMAARRLIHPTLHSSSDRFAQTATAVVGRAITCCSDLAASLQQRSSKVMLLSAGSHSITDWGAAKAELAASSSSAMQEYWEAVYSRRNLGVKVARSSEVRAWQDMSHKHGEHHHDQ